MSDVSKEIRINVRTTEQIKRDLEIAARLRGLTVSSLVNSLVVKAIREEKEREPHAFRADKAAEPPIFSPEDAAKFTAPDETSVEFSEDQLVAFYEAYQKKKQAERK